MNDRRKIIGSHVFFCVVNMLLFGDGSIYAADGRAMVVPDFEKGIESQSIQPHRARINVRREAAGKVLEIVTTAAPESWAGVTLSAPQGSWDLSAHRWISCDVENRGAEPVEVWMHMLCSSEKVPEDPDQRWDVRPRIVRRIPPGSTDTLTLVMSRYIAARLRPPVEFQHMHGAPGKVDRIEWRNIRTDNVASMTIFLLRPKMEHRIAVDNIRAHGSTTVYDSESFFPFVDRFGQFIHGNWPGKVTTDADIRTKLEAELADIQAHPAPGDRNRFGGWTAGPQLEATGSFRVEQYQSRWWLVDPDGRLFWSHGINCVTPGLAATPVSDREEYFAWLPAEDDPLAAYFGSRSRTISEFYKDKLPMKTYNFYEANMHRKYGPDWKSRFVDMALKRLPSWGINTIANWSDGRLYDAGKLPYARSVHFRRKVIEGTGGHWGKFPDPFDPGFATSCHAAFRREAERSGKDPFCIGYFVDNEFFWGNDKSLAHGVIASPPSQPAKIALIEFLKEKYKTIQQLNMAWEVAFDSWEAFSQHKEWPRPTSGSNRDDRDLEEFNRRIIQRYFRTISETIREQTPGKLYMGPRIVHFSEHVLSGMLPYVDVIGVNRYDRSCSVFDLPADISRPVIVGEFHFGALDRGGWHSSLRAVRNQEQRAEAYMHFVHTALEHPLIIGTHYFQYPENILTGRSLDGENHASGLISVADQPYAEMVAAMRLIGEKMYRYRLSGKKEAVKLPTIDHADTQ